MYKRGCHVATTSVCWSSLTELSTAACVPVSVAYDRPWRVAADSIAGKIIMPTVGCCRYTCNNRSFMQSWCRLSKSSGVHNCPSERQFVASDGRSHAATVRRGRLSSTRGGDSGSGSGGGGGGGADCLLWVYTTWSGRRSPASRRNSRQLHVAATAVLDRDRGALHDAGASALAVCSHWVAWQRRCDGRFRGRSYTDAAVVEKMLGSLV